MAVTPNTDLYLLQCPIELDNRNQINFSTPEAQFNYFSNLPTATNKSYYLRKTKKELVDMVLNHYINCVRDEKLNNIRV